MPYEPARRAALSRRARLFGVVALGLLLPCSAVAQTTVLPEWMSRGSRSWDGVPQLRGRTERFSGAAPLAGALSEALLLCRVHVTGRYDMFADPDLRVRATLGRRRVDWWGTENSRTEVFSVASISLRPGATLRFHVVDRDPTFDDDIGTIAGRYDGGAILLQEGPITVECRRLDAAEVAMKRADALARAEGDRARTAGAAPDLTADDLGRPGGVRGALIEAASWAGWSHPEVADARERQLRAESTFDGALARALAEARRASPRPGRPLTVQGGTVRVEALDCGARARRRLLPQDRSLNRCALMLQLEGDARIGTADVIGERGVIVAQPSVRYLDGDEAGTVVLALPRRPPPDAMLRFGSARHLLRLR